MFCQTSSGGKEWYGFLSELQGVTYLTVYWGPYGRVNQAESKIGSDVELSSVIKERINKGFIEKDRWINGDWTSLVEGPFVEVKSKAPKPNKPNKPSIMEGLKIPSQSLNYDF